MKNFKLRKLLITFAIFTLSLSIVVIKFFIIPPPEKSLGYNEHNISIFLNYSTEWESSTQLKQWGGIYLFLRNLAINYPFKLYSSNPNKYSFFDINGDGLNDFLYHEHYEYGSSENYLAVFLNTGNNNFELFYKCVEYHLGNSNHYYYGDCAQGSFPSEPEENMIQKVGDLINHCHSELGEYCSYFGVADVNGDSLIDMMMGNSILLNRGNLMFEEEAF